MKLVTIFLAACLALAAQSVQVVGPLGGTSSSGGGATDSADLTDIGAVAVAYSATPTFNAAAGNVFSLTLSGDAAPILSGEWGGQTITWRITQDEFGDHALTYPAEVYGGCEISPEADATTIITMAVVSGSETNVTFCGAPAEPDHAKFGCTSVASVGTPPSGSRTIFCNSDADDATAIKKSDGSVTSLEGGRVLARFTFGLGTAASGFSNSITGSGCHIDVGASINGSGTGLLVHGAPMLNRAANEGVNCRALVIPRGVNLKSLGFGLEAGEVLDAAGAPGASTWVGELLGQCLSSGQSIGSWTQVGSVSVGAANGTTAAIMVGSDNAVDLSGICTEGQALFLRFQVGSGSSATADLYLIGFTLYQI